MHSTAYTLADLNPKLYSTEDQVIAKLNALAQTPLKKRIFIKAYHDLLLFYKAYPNSAKVNQLAEKGLERIFNYLKKADPTNTSYSKAFGGSGLYHSSIHACFSYTMVQWLVHKFPGNVHLDTAESDSNDIRDVFQILLPGIEFESFSKPFASLKSAITFCSGLKKTDELISWLIHHLEHSRFSLEIRENLFRQLKIFIRWDLKDLFFNYTALKIPEVPVFYHRSLIKTALPAKPNNKLGLKEVVLSASERTELLDIMKASLAMQHRETDPITYGNSASLQLIDVGRGLRVAVVAILPEKQLVLESYFGFMAFKNGYPVSYGGGWIFGKQCTVGVNIFSAYRSGESAWLFNKILYSYQFLFGVSCFVVKPYQFGKNNREGLKTGAFWFYYKLGFRPVENSIADKANEEWKKIRANTGYRSSISVLQYFTGSPVCLCLKNKPESILSAGSISLAISAYIQKQYHGDRIKAVFTEKNKFRKEVGVFLSIPLKKIPPDFVANWCLFAACIGPVSEWSLPQKKSFIKWMEWKACNAEKDFIRAMQKKEAFPENWVKKITSISAK